MKCNMALMQSIADYTLKTAHSYTDETATEKESRRWHRWDWSIGVGFYGVLKANNVLKNDSFVQSIKKWVDDRLEKIPCFSVNTCGVMPAVLDIAEMFGSDMYGKVIRDFDEYVANNALRTPSNTIAHSVIGSELPGEIWADTLFMAVLYLAKRSKMLGCDTMLKEAINQLVLHVDKLYDETTNLFFHGYDDISEKPMGTLWGRGNTWITVATVEIMDIIGRENVPEETLNKVKAQLDALSKYQLDNGMWATVIDHPYETYEETSITAGTAYAVLHGVQRGYFEERHLHMAEKAIGALMQNISDEGSVQKGSTGTPIKENVAAYNEIAYNVTPFTQGLALMALNKKTPST